ncbi:MAG: Eco29kI family restriction endonuclease [Gemmataceae bacterium]|nr:Eco29kI family restriction endonuclease [Gemmataceae bacterium]
MTTPFDAAHFLRAAAALRAFADPDAAMIASLRSRSRDMGKLLGEIAACRTRLDELEKLLDEVVMPPFVFDLSNPEMVGEVIAAKLEQQPKTRLGDLPRFYGSGVYILYYSGPSPVYAAISGTEVPIYVGSKAPKSKGAASPREQGVALFDRITEHRARSIEKAASTLDAQDFHVRYLVVHSGNEKAAEDHLIRRYSPVWNDEAKVCSGLGKHGDVARGEKSQWDVLHPGRPWAARQASRSGATPDTVRAAIQGHFLTLLRQDRPRWSKAFAPA